MEKIEQRRLHVGGLYDGVTEQDIKNRFGKFGNISSVNIKSKGAENGFPCKVFAYMNIDISEKSFKQCMQIYNKTKWKGQLLQIQPAKNSFIDRLAEERKVESESRKEKKPAFEKTLKHETVRDKKVSNAKPGSEVADMENWVVGKYGRVLPVMKMKGKDKRKFITHDPSKFCHSLKKVDSKEAKGEMSVSDLTWNITDPDSEMSRKRKGEFPEMKVKKVIRSHAPKGDSRSNDNESGGSTVTTKLYDSDFESDMDTNVDKKTTTSKSTPGKRKTPQKKEQKEKPVIVCSGNRGEDKKSIINSKAKQSSAQDQKNNQRSNVTAARSNVKCSYSNPQKTITPSQSRPMSKRMKRLIKKTHDLYTSQDKETNNDGDSDSEEIASYKKKHLSQECSPRGLSSEIKLLDSHIKGNKSLNAADEFYGGLLEVATVYRRSSVDVDSDNDVFEAIAKGKLNKVISRNKLNANPGIPPTKEDNFIVVPDSESRRPTEQNVKGLDSKPQNEGISDSLADASAEESSNEESPEETHVSNGKDIGSNESISDEDQSDDNSSDSDKSESDAKSSYSSKTVEKASGTKQSKTVQNNSSDEEELSNDNSFKNDVSVSAESIKPDPETPSADALSSSSDSFENSSSDESSEGESEVGSLSVDSTTTNKKNAPENAPHKRSPKLSSSATVVAKKPEAEKNGMQMKELKRDKQLLSNQKRLESLKARQEDAQSRQNAIKIALSSIDNKAANKKTVFDSDSEEDFFAPKIDKTDLTQAQVKKKTARLFEESSDDGEESDDDAAKFEIREEFEGKSGRKLMELQSKFSNDKRFKLDKRFIEVNEESSDDEEITANEDEDEKEKSLKILNSIIKGGVKVAKKQDKMSTFKDMTSRRFDPTSENHEEFEVKREAQEKKTPQKKKKNSEAADAEEHQPVPEISKEKFYQVGSDLKSVFESSAEQPFSFLSAFGSNTTQTEPEEVEVESQEPETLNRGKNLPWQSNNFAYDSSEDEEIEARQKGVAESDSSSTRASLVTQTEEFFFWSKDDPKIQEAIDSFWRKEDMQVLREKWLEIRPELVETYRKKRKNALRKMKQTHTPKKISKWKNKRS